MKRSIVWFKTDLGLHDNETLIHAIEQSDEVIVYCLDESHFKITEFGFQKTENFRLQFLLESIKDLDLNLRELGSGLILVKGKPQSELFKIAKHFGATKIFAKREVVYEETQTEQILEREVWKLHCAFESFSTSTLYHAQDLPFSIKDIPDVFTNFKRQVEHESAVRPIFQKPLKIKSPVISPIQIPPLEELGLEFTTQGARAAFNFKGGGKRRIQTIK